MLGCLINKLISPSRVLFVPNNAKQTVCTPLIFKNKRMNGILNNEVPFC